MQLNYNLVEIGSMDQFNRYADLSLYETELMTSQNHILAAYTMQPVAGFGYLQTAAHGGSDDNVTAHMIERDECQGPVYYQKWQGMKPTTPIISVGMNALRLPAFFENIGHGNLINTAGGCYGHIDSPVAGSKSLTQAFDC